MSDDQGKTNRSGQAWRSSQAIDGPGGYGDGHGNGKWMKEKSMKGREMTATEESGMAGMAALIKRYRARRFRRGFSLFGVLLGLGLAAVVIVGAVGTYNAAREAANRSEALVLLNRIRANIEPPSPARRVTGTTPIWSPRSIDGAAFPIAPGRSGPATRPRSAILSAGW